MLRKRALGVCFVLWVGLGVLVTSHAVGSQLVGDLDENGIVDGQDLTLLFDEWGFEDTSAADLNNDGRVDGRDLTILLKHFGEQTDDGGIGNDIQTIASGSGFMAVTSQPSRQGNPTSPGYGAKAIARWTELPYITRDQDFYVTVSAYHMVEIARVDFILNGGEPVTCTEVQPHPETGYAEYIVKVDVSELAVGKHEIRAIAYPNHGEPRVLQGTTPEGDIHIANNGNESFWFTYHPNPTTAYVGGPNGQFSTIQQAVNSLGSELHAGRIYLAEGTHPYFQGNLSTSFKNSDYDQVLTISGAPDADPQQVFLEPAPHAGARAPGRGSLHFRNLSIVSSVRDDYVPAFCASGGNNRLFLEGIFNTSTEIADGWANYDIQKLAKPYWTWAFGVWMKDCTLVNVPGGIDTVMLGKNVKFKRISADAFGGCPGAVINCHVDMGDVSNSYHGMHIDIVQCSVSYEGVENRIYADIRATNHAGQPGHFETAPVYRNFAFVRWEIDNSYHSHVMGLYPRFEHIVIDGLTFRDSDIYFHGTFSHVLIRDTLLWRYRGGQWNETFDPATRVIENVHFEDRNRGWGANPPTFELSTEGPVTFAAPSPPVGVSSNGTGMYIPTFVQTPAQITSQFLGNRECADYAGTLRDHFYYDESLLDLTWWRN